MKDINSDYLTKEELISALSDLSSTLGNYRLSVKYVIRLLDKLEDTKTEFLLDVDTQELIASGVKLTIELIVRKSKVVRPIDLSEELDDIIRYVTKRVGNKVKQNE